ncbi:MAG: hypothetical protein II746_09640, partial [Bacteroidaceae bacterium]|nr:hypothetical protein [Bacteroidaceae bacterium]
PSCVVLSARGGFFWPETYRFEFFKDGFSMDIQEITASLDPWWYGPGISPVFDPMKQARP